MSRILGIDPGLASTGFGCIEKVGGRLKLVDYGIIKTPASWDQGARLLHIYEELTRLIARFKPAGAGVEKLYFSKNVSSALPVAEARGVVLLCLAREQVFTQEFEPAQLKKGVVGEARADKQQVQQMVKIILGMQELPAPDHAADALAAAIYFEHAAGLGAWGER